MKRRNFCGNLTKAALLASVVNSGPALAGSVDRKSDQMDREQRESLDLLLSVLTPSRPPATGRINAIDRTWEEWQKRTGELPPKFSRVPAQPLLPDVLSGVRNLPDWSRRKEEIRAQLE